ncbi:Lrp/AsnC family transcriptional regulator [Sulfurisphaera tokodaii]|uniref:Lrp family transcriptional regulator n=2 Tax=Sulfurisphaera tokodaii TaxID=111955 RepID=Q972L7_SULTO|nr:Lrp/AsnC family transcriptional regulator [Sulfurisphaera tokodaii]BAB66148.1 putative Lrp family transcriptional regulator [Sulfurisphaera tokodaii str. 7]HII74646.1 Lrp/AsnC family transcriptional regulator [Sulfurisphaera tokodaii]
MDEIDLKILKILQKDAKYSLEDLSTELKMPKSTVAYRIKRLESLNIIKGYYAQIDPTALNLDYIVISLIRGKYSKDYHIELGSKLANIPGVWGVYFVLGDTDFIVIARYRNREDFMKNYLERITSMPEVERSSTHVVVKIIKESPNMVIWW